MDNEVLGVLEDVCNWIKGYYTCLGREDLESEWKEKADLIKKNRAEIKEEVSDGRG